MNLTHERDKKVKVVVMGGGNGSATTLRALKHHRDVFDISAIISMSDSGGSSGKLREEFNTLPPSDIMRAICALSSNHYKEIMKPMFYSARFKGVGKLDGHNLGNLFLVLAAKFAGDYMFAIKALHQAVGAVGTAHPATLDQSDLVAELTNGQIIRTEAAIDRPTYDRSLKIKKVWLEPEARAAEGAVKAIDSADVIILGPGSLYSSVIASVLPKGIGEAIGRSKARLIHIVGNKYELDGETGPTELTQALWTLEEYLPRKIATVIFNTWELTAEQVKYYREKRWALMKYNPEFVKKSYVIGAPFERDSGGLSATKLGLILRKYLLVGSD